MEGGLRVRTVEVLQHVNVQLTSSHYLNTFRCATHTERILRTRAEINYAPSTATKGLDPRARLIVCAGIAALCVKTSSSPSSNMSSGLGNDRRPGDPRAHPLRVVTSRHRTLRGALDHSGAKCGSRERTALRLGATPPTTRECSHSPATQYLSAGRAVRSGRQCG